jgi:hypothetical protein
MRKIEHKAGQLGIFVQSFDLKASMSFVGNGSGKNRR